MRVVPPSPALSLANVRALNRSTDSLSSIYSRSVTGERYTHSQQRPQCLSDGRSFSSSSMATVKKSPLGMMRLASDPEIVIDRDRRSMSDASSTSDIDDAATLQARLPSVKAVSEFGDVFELAGKGEVSSAYYQKSYEACIGEMMKVDFAPLNVKRTRDSVSSCHKRVAMAG